MKSIKEIAQAHNLSTNTVRKWPVAKRERSTRLIDMNICPQQMQLVGELYAICFASSNMDKKMVLNAYTVDGYGHFDVYVLGTDSEYPVPLQDLTVANLRAAIKKVEGIIYG